MRNLRWVTQQENSVHRTRLSKNNTSGFLGVSRMGTRWRAYFTAGGEHLFLGLFDTAEDAARARDAFVLGSVWRDLAMLNFPREIKAVDEPESDDDEEEDATGATEDENDDAEPTATATATATATSTAAAAPVSVEARELEKIRQLFE